ncbi:MULTISPECIES: hypothetical protein [unclassified Actinopolyspora]|uniref:hypothetical protein n=1 Tax=unclassified Actinopolyspora TaxID=2639451 RepID=UPI0013F6093B|nr:MULTISPECIES: hypothetical protein [unclassified Actinopolyspora]NHD19501.1 hypothetical protein [Actinopolyspora sp. BKK2]NHE77441.1 hypothetical protein [Actinopolyspora sp. BKK1]
MSSEPALRLRVPADGDSVLEERLVRSLRSELDEVTSVDTRIAADPASAPTGAKAGAALGEIALWVALGTVGKDTVSVVLESIRAWSAKQHDRIVHLRTKDGAEYQLPPDMDETQQHLVNKILENERS